MPPADPLKVVLGLEPVGWMMSPSERLAMIGLLATLRPGHSLELGCAEGGLTAWLSAYSGHVVTVDIDERVLRMTERFPNVEPLCTTTEEAVRRLEGERRTFDLTVIDADHSESGVRRDLEAALRFSRFIILHDTYYPPCREGMEAVLDGRDVYRELDLVPGGLQPDGLWGGLGIVIPGLPRAAATHVTSRLSQFPSMRRRWLADQFRARARRWLRSAG
ncbi:MAG TPA: class I SAM-dependent methyltransferase [Dehalococcoidia bacterium]|nr:class I SAM-dependent methyltransferase [Dehalococcoidia bacterium]